MSAFMMTATSLAMMFTVMLVRPVVSCDREMVEEMQARFGQCTSMYRQQYEAALVEGDQEQEMEGVHQIGRAHV